LPEEPQHLVISNLEEFEAIEVEPDGTLDRNDDLSLFQFGLQNADFGKVQRKLD
jgi:hypothetical protein